LYIAGIEQDNHHGRGCEQAKRVRIESFSTSSATRRDSPEDRPKCRKSRSLQECLSSWVHVRQFRGNRLGKKGVSKYPKVSRGTPGTRSGVLCDGSKAGKLNQRSSAIGGVLGYVVIALYVETVSSPVRTLWPDMERKASSETCFVVIVDSI
jgi:hypothetical protein